jgi:hypothetical protein
MSKQQHEAAERELAGEIGFEYELVKKHAAESEEFADLLGRFHDLHSRRDAARKRVAAAQEDVALLEGQRREILNAISEYVIDKEEDIEDARRVR